MAIFEIPLSPAAQTFAISLGGQDYRLTMMWRDADEIGWVLDIASAQGAPIVSGIPLVTGADLLSQYAYLGFTGALVVQTDHDTDVVPTYENLGELSHLYFVTK